MITKKHSDPILVQLAEARVPRYTSYPTALQFNEDVGPDTCSEWLSELGNDDSLSLYVHVPFCESLCWYCGCHTTVPNGYDRAARYVDTLLAEIKMKAACATGAGQVSHVHFGGGTPTFLKPDDFLRVVDAMKANFTFASDAEIAVEIDPRTIDSGRLEGLVKAGVNRASIGVQDFNEEVQHLVNRVQPVALVEKCVADLRANGIENISFDLIYGLPGQNENSVRMTARVATRMRPDRLSVFGYAHVPWFKSHQKVLESTELPDVPERMRQADAIAEELTGQGYVQIGFDHFALADDAMAQSVESGDLKRNFQGYTTDQASALIGFGASAISNFPAGIVQNEPHLGKYQRLIMDDGLPAVKGVRISDEDRFRGEIISHLMCDMKVDLRDVAAHHGRDVSILAENIDRLQPLEEAGLLERSDYQLKMTAMGRPFARNVAACFDPYLSSVEGRHSQGV